jgi:hypothetical protein
MLKIEAQKTPVCFLTNKEYDIGVTLFSIMLFCPCNPFKKQLKQYKTQLL